MPWEMRIGDLAVGRLADERTDEDHTLCHFEPNADFARYAPAFRTGDISEIGDDALDALVDEIAVDGVFLVDADGSEIVDPDLRIDGSVARF